MVSTVMESIASIKTSVLLAKTTAMLMLTALTHSVALNARAKMASAVTDSLAKTSTSASLTTHAPNTLAAQTPTVESSALAEMASSETASHAGTLTSAQLVLIPVTRTLPVSTSSVPSAASATKASERRVMLASISTSVLLESTTAAAMPCAQTVPVALNANVDPVSLEMERPAWTSMSVLTSRPAEVPTAPTSPVDSLAAVKKASPRTPKVTVLTSTNAPLVLTLAPPKLPAKTPTVDSDAPAMMDSLATARSALMSTSALLDQTIAMLELKHA